MIRLAYLSTMYPSLSHTFIEREIRMLRQLGLEIDTFSVRPPRPQDLLSDHHRQAGRDTYCILQNPFRTVGKQLTSALRHPVRTLRTYIAGQRLAPPGLRSRLLHLAYAVEAVVLATEMRRRGLRHVHVHFAHNGATVALLATRFDPSLEYSLTIHGSMEFFNVDGFRLREKIAGAAFTRCIAQFGRAQVMNLCAPQHWDRLPVVHCGIDVDEYTPPPRTDDQDHALRLLTVGRLHPIKGYPLLLDAVRILRDEGVDVRLDMVGDGEQRQWLQQYALELGISDVVTFSGAVGQDRIRQHYERANVMVLCSFMEGLPVVLMEAMAMQLAVVASQVAGIPEMIEHGRNGLLITPGSLHSLCDALRRLAAHPNQRDDLARAGRTTIEQRYTIQQTGRQMLECFQCFAAVNCSTAQRSPRTAPASAAQPAPVDST